MDEFTIVLSKETKLFKGTKYDGISEKLKGPFWMAFDKDIALNYARMYARADKSGELYEIVLKKELRLIDITSMKFKIDFWDRCTKLYCDNNTKDPRKIRALIPLGIPNLETQKTFVKNEIASHCDNSIQIWGNLMGGHRCSSPDGDIHMVETMIEIYKDSFDGFVQSVNLPTCFHDNFHFPSEVCLFKTKGYLKKAVRIQEVPKSTSMNTGGSIDMDKNLMERENITHQDWMRAQTEVYRGYKGKLTYDEFGFVQGVGYEGILKDREKQARERAKKEARKRPKSAKTFTFDEHMNLVEKK